MDLLLRLIERRTIVGLSLLLAAGVIVNRFGAYWLERLDMKLHPPAPVTSILAPDILKDVETREAARVRGLHRAVSADIAAARRAGFDVAPLQKVADDILALDKPEYRATAIERLNKLRMTIPQQKSFTRTAGSDDQNPDALETPSPKPARKPAKKRR